MALDKLHNNHQEPNEILGLCSTLDYQISSVFTQKIQNPNPKYFIGRGKVSEIAEYISNNDKLEFVAFDCALKPNQIFNLENSFQIRVLDRNALILMIFLHHARTKEAKLQVEYAILKHQIPYVTELVRRSKRGEHPGLMAGGEYKVDEYYRLTKTRIKKIRSELVKIKVSRDQRRKHRRRRGFVLVTVAGYTNAGKSALLKALTDAQVLIDDRMFATVSPKTRRFRNTNVLFTDTVGFIQNIPTQLIEAFKSTLEEITDADHIMIVIDLSEDLNVIKKKILTCFNTIDQLIIEKSGDMTNFQATMPGTRPYYHLIFNKIDIEPNSEEKSRIILNDLDEEFSVHGISSVFHVSCVTKAGLEKMINKLDGLASKR